MFHLNFIGMKKFVIERELPGAGKLSRKELKAIAFKSCEVVEGLGSPYHWIQTFVADDKLYCVHIAPDEETVRRHAEIAGFPVNRVTEVKEIIDPATGG
jgi:hypothetical protein